MLYVRDTNLQHCSEKQFSQSSCCGFDPNEVGFVVLLLFFLWGAFYLFFRVDGKLSVYGGYLLIEKFIITFFTLKVHTFVTMHCLGMYTFSTES